MVEYPLRLDTLGKLIEHEHKLWLFCYAYDCNFNREIDLPKLAEHLGHDHGCMHDDLIPKHLFCPKCRSRDVGVRLMPPHRGNSTR